MGVAKISNDTSITDGMLNLIQQELEKRENRLNIDDEFLRNHKKRKRGDEGRKRKKRNSTKTHENNEQHVSNDNNLLDDCDYPFDGDWETVDGHGDLLDGQGTPSQTNIPPQLGKVPLAKPILPQLLNLPINHKISQKLPCNKQGYTAIIIIWKR